MTDPEGDDHITLNRSDLLRACDGMEQAFGRYRNHMPDGWADGFKAAIDGFRSLADKMPDGCVLIPRKDYDRYNRSSARHCRHPR